MRVTNGAKTKAPAPLSLTARNTGGDATTEDRPRSGWKTILPACKPATARDAGTRAGRTAREATLTGASRGRNSWHRSLGRPSSPSRPDGQDRTARRPKARARSRVRRAWDGSGPSAALPTRQTSNLNMGDALTEGALLNGIILCFKRKSHSFLPRHSALRD